MFKWIKLGNVFDPRDFKSVSWMQEFAQSPSTLIFEKHVRVFFCSRTAPAADGQYLSYLSFVDLDRGNLLKIVNICKAPILSLGEFGSFDEFGTNPVSAIRHENEVRVYYAGWTRCESVPFNAAIGLAISRDDGDSFTRLGLGPVLSYDPDEPFLIGSPRVRMYEGEWRLWYVAGRAWLNTGAKPEPVYKIRMARSEDGIVWTKHGKDLLPDRLGVHECQACPDVIFRDGKYHMFFCYRQSHDYKKQAGGYRIGYAASIDMENWTRHDEVAGIGISETGWDSEMVSYPHVFVVDGEYYMLYQGNGMGRTGIGLAKLDGNRTWD